MMAQRSRPGFANGNRRGRTRGPLLAALLAGTALAGGAGEAVAQQYAPYNPFAAGPVPYTALQGGSQGYAQAPYQQPYGVPGYANPYGGGAAVVGGGGSIVYDRSVLGGGYQPPFYAGVTGQQGYQYAAPAPYAAAPAPYAPPVQAPPNGVYGQAGGLLVPGPVTPQSQLYIQPGVAAPGYAQAQIGVASGTVPPPPPPTSTASTGAVSTAVGTTGTANVPSSRPQVATATPPTPPSVPEIAPPPPPSTADTSSGPARVPVIVEESAPPPPPPPPPTAAVTTPPAPPPPPPPEVEAEEPPAPEDTRTVADILQPPPPPPPAQAEEEPEEEAPTEVASAAPTPPPPAPPTPSSDAPALTPSVRTEDAPPPVPEAPQTPEVAATTDVPAIPTPPVPDAPTAATDGSVALSIPFGGGESDLPAAAQDELRAIAQQMAGDETLRLTIRAYAEGTAEDASQARRLSLSRALAIRSFLIEQGIRGPRMDVRALGHRIEPPRDRVDLVLVSQ